MKEIWKDIPGYEGLYQVSNFGQVKSLNYWRKKEEKILKPKHSSLYYVVCLCKNGASKYRTIHSLVAECFIPNIEKKKQINHINGDKHDNAVTNLEWVTPRENVLHSVHTLNNNPREWSKTPVRCVETGDVFDTQVEAAKAYHTSQGAIGNSARKNRPLAGGFHWEFIRCIDEE